MDSKDLTIELYDLIRIVPRQIVLEKIPWTVLV